MTSCEGRVLHHDVFAATRGSARRALALAGGRGSHRSSSRRPSDGDPSPSSSAPSVGGGTFSMFVTWVCWRRARISRRRGCLRCGSGVGRKSWLSPIQARPIRVGPPGACSGSERAPAAEKEERPGGGGLKARQWCEGGGTREGGQVQVGKNRASCSSHSGMTGRRGGRDGRRLIGTSLPTRTVDLVFMLT